MQVRVQQSPHRMEVNGSRIFVSVFFVNVTGPLCSPPVVVILGYWSCVFCCQMVLYNLIYIYCAIQSTLGAFYTRVLQYLAIVFTQWCKTKNSHESYHGTLWLLLHWAACCNMKPEEGSKFQLIWQYITKIISIFPQEMVVLNFPFLLSGAPGLLRVCSAVESAASSATSAA